MTEGGSNGGHTVGIDRSEMNVYNDFKSQMYIQEHPY